MSKLVICRQDRTDCFAYVKYWNIKSGYCKCLSDTRFNYPCPFYKTMTQAKRECPEIAAFEED